MISNFRKNICLNSKTFLNITKNNFSVFAKLKDYLKSGAQSTVTMFGANIDPEKLKVEIDDELSTKKTQLKKKSINLTQEEQKLVDRLPKQIISNYLFNLEYERNITLIEQEKQDRVLLNEMISELQKEDTTEQIKKTIKSKYQTIWEKIDNYEATSEGKIILPNFLENNAAKKFESMKEYVEWKDNKISELKDKMFNKLTPMEHYITQGKGTERPYTGDYWDTSKVGVYCCKVCTQRLFSSTHKYQAKGIGHAIFWNFLPFTLNFHEDELGFPQPTQAIYKIQFASSKAKKRITCSNVIIL